MVVQDMETAQVAVLGSLLISPELVGEAMNRVRAEDFTTPRHRMTFQAIRDVFVSGGTVDLVSVLARLGAKGDQAWSQYLMELMDRTPTAANIWLYADTMREQARLFRLRELGERQAQACSLEDAAKCLADGNALMVDKPGMRYVTMEQALLDFYSRHKEKKTYLTWGLDKLNDRLFVDRGDMVVLGGHASAGKTLLAVQFAWHWAKLGRKVGFYSLETDEAKLEDRLIAYNMHLDFGKIKRSELTEEDYEALALASQRLIQPKLEWVPASGMTVDEIRSSALSRGYDAIFVDYLQLIPGDKRRNRTEEVAGISIGLHQMSQSTGITVVALSQLSRPEKGGDRVRAPTMASLRESGQIEQDADVVMLLYKEEDTQNSRRVLHIAKNKEGETGKIYLAFDGAHQRLYESAVDAPAPRARREPEYKQVQFTELTGACDDPFEQGGDRYGQAQSGRAVAAGDPAPGGTGADQQLPGGSPAGGAGAGTGCPDSGGGDAT